MFDEFYGLKARPFQLTPDPEFYFESLTHRKALSYLGYGLAQGEGFVVITGEVGSGKSTLVAHLMETIDPARMTAANVVTSALDGGEIVHVVAQAFGLPVPGHDKASALGAIEAFLHAEARLGRRCLLIIDEAQNLSIGALEELRMLSNFQLGSHPLLQTLLLGQPEFRETLADSDQLEQLRQRVIAAHHLGPMEREEVQAYIEHRLGRAGWSGNPGFDADVFAAIHEASGGIPRRINQIVNRLLLLGAVEQRAHIDSAMVAQVLEEMNSDGAMALARPQPQAEAPATEETAGGEAPVAPPAAPAGLAGEAGFDAAGVAALIEQALADRDARIGELEQAMLELAAAPGTREPAWAPEGDGKVAELEARLAEVSAYAAKLEARLDEQEHMLRHTLTMLIEWIESDGGRREAA
ncbi:XrtA/PEP-CTERM system-associated ATPase [Novosphingobium beihaiensis]|uniref:XrtA-associated ATPase n=1 Tax=Novosphingobium beihaiensis TaxID=2930389 RepID=A0ABT0BQG0_9SPHN|nr:XrtA/PEP-CTERM system-associated ATPase [Novosphingobium beihaiensis]MCJ2187294.1 XrtA-associated ATPase [Novosphingobium beihaiensis]